MIGVTVTIDSADAVLDGELTVPDVALGVVVFAHGSGSSRFSPRNRAVAAELRLRGFGTLLFDLLRPDEEEQDRRGATVRFDVALLAPRLAAAVALVRRHPASAELPVGVFGASTGAGVALLVAARQPSDVAAVVSRGGRPDLAGAELHRVQAPTLLVVGERDPQVLALNRQAAAALPTAEVVLVPGATHLFAEPGALAVVSGLAADWFGRYLRPPDQPA
ncbi:MAG: dienelactone hydrolase family protein [Thermocrispum sp.]